MKMFFIVTLIIVLVALCFCIIPAKEDYLRIHIRANSNLDKDQQIKYEVKEIVVDYLKNFLNDCSNKTEAKEIIISQKDELIHLINKHLALRGANYESNIKINKEYFPTREYGDVKLNAGEYEALIINLGSGDGNNWWCVAFPPLCFEAKPNLEVEPKWLIKELFDKIKASRS